MQIRGQTEVGNAMLKVMKLQSARELHGAASVTTRGATRVVMASHATIYYYYYFLFNSFKSLQPPSLVSLCAKEKKKKK
jgi:hypothetical protein